MWKEKENRSLNKNLKINHQNKFKQACSVPFRFSWVRDCSLQAGAAWASAEMMQISRQHFKTKLIVAPSWQKGLIIFEANCKEPFSLDKYFLWIIFYVIIRLELKKVIQRILIEFNFEIDTKVTNCHKIVKMLTYFFDLLLFAGLLLSFSDAITGLSTVTHLEVSDLNRTKSFQSLR